MARSQRAARLIGAIVSTALLGALPIAALQADDDDHPPNQRTFRIGLTGFEEVPSISSGATGEFHARISRDEKSISYELSYAGLEGDVRQSHIHFGQKSVNGAITVFLCQTTFNPDPTGLAPTCPQEGTVSGTLVAANMTGAAVAQGIAAGEFAELVKAIRARRAYANVHSLKFPGGEIRGQIR
jgi:hypothetical protein